MGSLFFMNDLETLRQAGLDKVLTNYKLRLMFSKLAEEKFGSSCLNCTNKLKSQYREMFKTENMGQYKLKPGSVIHMTSDDWKGDIGNGNLTDEIAEKLLNRNLKYISYFSEAPNIERLRKGVQEGVRTLNELVGVEDIVHEETYLNELIAIAGIGQILAEKLVANFPTKDVLLDAVEHEVSMPFLGSKESTVKTLLKGI